MKKLFGVIAAVLCAVVAVSCNADMDPYEGGTGVRVNINGRTFVLYGSPSGTYSYNNNPGNVYIFQLNAELLSKTNDMAYNLKMSLSSYRPFETGKSYEIGVSSACRASLFSMTDKGHVYGDEIPLRGEIVFLNVDRAGGKYAAKFTLESISDDGRMSLRHGFLRF